MTRSSGKLLREKPLRADGRDRLAAQSSKSGRTRSVKPGALAVSADYGGCAGCEGDQLRLLRRLIIAFVLTLPLMVSPHPYIQMVFGCALLLGPGNLFLKNAVMSVRNRRPGMDLLIACSTTIIFLYSTYVTFTVTEEVKVYFECEGILICLLLFGRYLESAARAETESSVRSLLNLQPVEARVLRVDETGKKKRLKIKVTDLCVTDEILVEAGERIPADGVIREGTILVDESMVTGESVPIRHSGGASVTGGTLVRSGSAHIAPSRIGEPSYLDQMIALVEKAQASGGASRTLADSIAAKFIPAVFLACLVTFFVWYFAASPGDAGTAVLNACGVLVVACPCALGLAVPTSVMVGMGRGAELGILFRNADQLTGAAHIKTIVFDKTGTLTDGTVSFKEKKDGTTDFTDFEVGEEHIRPGAKDAVKDLEAQGIQVVMLSGDKKEAAGKAAAGLGISRVKSGVRPDGKAAEIEKLKKEDPGSTVAMVGDGINDAPALATADISFAITDGTDIAKQSAGILLPGSRLSKISTAIQLSKAVNRNIRGNLLWALLYNLVSIPLAAMGIINPSLASAFMSISSIAVLMHALSLKKACT